MVFPSIVVPGDAMASIAGGSSRVNRSEPRRTRGNVFEARHREE
jgi:hypothetical protein